MLALDQRADLMDLLMADAVVPNEQRGNVCVVTVRGPLEHHDCGYGDSYDGIAARLSAAFANDETKCVVLRIDSPGGVVSGLNQTVYSMRKGKTKPVYVYVDEMACSAAFALACIGDEIIVPSSGIVGSIGVISTICEQTGADKKAGLNFVTITSGARKADGHPHVPLSDGAVKAETARVEKLAQQFFKLVERARGIDAQPLQAGIFLGKDGVAKGLADDVMGFDAMMAKISLAYPGAVVSPSRVAQTGTQASAPSARNEMLRLKAMIAKMEAELSAGGKPAKMLALAGNIEAAKKTYKKMTEEETEETNDHEEEAEEANDEAESEEESGGNDTDRDEEFPPKKDDKKKDDSDDDDDDSEESEESDAKKVRKAEDADDDAEAIAALRKMAAKAGGKVSAALANLVSERVTNQKLSGRIAAIEKRNATDEKNSRIEAHLSTRKITKAEAKDLRAKPLAFVKDYLGMRKNAIVRAPSEAITPDFNFAGDVENGYGDQGGAQAHFSPEETKQNEAMIADIVARSGGKVTREMVIKDYKKRLSALNGATKGRY